MVELFDTYGVLHIGTAVFYFDLEDLVLIQSRNWYADKDGYLTSSYYYLGQLRIVRFHRGVAHAQPGQSGKQQKAKSAVLQLLPKQ